MAPKKRIKHTPGPWKWAAPTREGSDRVVILDGGGDRAVVFHDAHWLPTKADRALIAAAPDLLAALKAHVEFQRRGGDIAAIVERSEAAIAKAEGRG